MAPRRSRVRITERLAEDLADAMFALSTPSRVLILARLLDGPCSVSELSAGLGMEQSAVSHQLRVLRQHRLVSVARDGRRRLYTIGDDHVVTLLEEGLRHVEGRGRRGSGLRRALGGAPE